MSKSRLYKNYPLLYSSLPFKEFIPLLNSREGYKGMGWIRLILFTNSTRRLQSKSTAPPSLCFSYIAKSEKLKKREGTSTDGSAEQFPQ